MFKNLCFGLYVCFILFVFGSTFISVCFSQQIVVQEETKITDDYEKAYNQAKEGNKLLVVTVGAEWCAACKTQKEHLLELVNSGSVKECVFVKLDKDKHPEWCEQIMDGTTLPQTHVYVETLEGNKLVWKKFHLKGIQSHPRLKELVNKAKSLLRRN